VPGKPLIRPAALADAARIRALRLEMLADAPLAFIERLDEAAGRSHEQFRARLAERVGDPGSVQLVAEADGRIVGQAGALAAPGTPGVSLVFAVYISPPWRGTGLLARLLDALGEWSRAAGRPTLELEVVTSNERAVRAYGRVGFVDTGLRTRHPTIPVLTEMVMTRAA
jgi:GNAT superfamily N-acetyltransferase